MLSTGAVNRAATSTERYPMPLNSGLIVRTLEHLVSIGEREIATALLDLLKRAEKQAAEAASSASISAQAQAALSAPTNPTARIANPV
jgi:hypothetical protein